MFVEVLRAYEQQSSDPEDRIAFPAAMLQSCLLHALVAHRQAALASRTMWNGSTTVHRGQPTLSASVSIATSIPGVTHRQHRELGRREPRHATFTDGGLVGLAPQTVTRSLRRPPTSLTLSPASTGSAGY